MEASTKGTLMPCMTNYKDNIIKNEESLSRSDNQQINITECWSPNDEDQMVENECQVLTEGSSSFGDTVSGAENCSVLDGDQVESQYCENPSVSLYDDIFHARKKKLSAHWKTFIRPLMWRCKWLELQLKELQSQTLKYDSELAECDKVKQYEFGGYTAEGVDGKSIPFSSQNQNSKLKKRKKRKRIEDYTDILLFASDHKFLSYYENKRSGANRGSMEEDCGNLGKSNHGIHEFDIEFRDGDCTLENYLQKIEVAHSQILRFKTRIDKVLKDNPALFGSAQSHALESGNDILVETLSYPSQRSSECNDGPVLLPSSAVSSLEVVNLLPAEVGNTDHPLVDTEQENAGDGHLVPNAFVKKEPDIVENSNDQVVEKPLLSSTPHKTKLSVPASKTLPKRTSTPKASIPNASDQPDSTKKTEFPWNTRNRGKHKTGMYRLSRKS